MNIMIIQQLKQSIYTNDYVLLSIQTILASTIYISIINMGCPCQTFLHSNIFRNTQTINLVNNWFKREIVIGIIRDHKIIRETSTDNYPFVEC